MPPRIQVPEEQIIEKALHIIRENGMEALNARSLANALGCSVQPIFRAFDNMEDLKRKVTAVIANQYRQCLLSGMACENPMSGLLLAYVRYAREEKNFFKLLHMSDRLNLHNTEDFTRSDINLEIIERMAKQEGLSVDDAETLYVGSFFAAHGIASLLATNHCDFTDERIGEIMADVYEGLLLKLKG